MLFRSPRAFADAVRCGYDIDTLVTAFDNTIRSYMAPNLFINDTGHGLEKSGATEAVNSMMLSSAEGLVEVFPNWYKNKDAKFSRLRAKGAFLVSSEYDGEQQTVTSLNVKSEKGSELKLVNPWITSAIVKKSDGTVIPTTKGFVPNQPESKTIEFDTISGETYTITTDSNIAPTYKTVTVSSELDGFDVSGAVDGLLVSNPTSANGWATGNGWATCMPGVGGQVSGDWWLKLEFEQPVNISRWVVRNYGLLDNAPARNTKDCQLQTSTDGVNWIAIDTVTGNSSNVIDKNLGNSILTKYVRLHITKPIQNDEEMWQLRAAIVEFELYAETKEVNINIAPTYKTVTASSELDGFDVSGAVDGLLVPNPNSANGWATGNGWATCMPGVGGQVSGDWWLKLEFEQPVNISRWVVRNYGLLDNAPARNTKDCQLQTSTDGVNWIAIDTVTGNSSNVIDKNLGNSILTKYVRLHITKPIQNDEEMWQLRATIVEFELYG